MGHVAESSPGSFLRIGSVPGSGLLQASDWPSGRPVLLPVCGPQRLGHGAGGRSTVRPLAHDQPTAGSNAVRKLRSWWLGFHAESSDWSTQSSLRISVAEWRGAGPLCRSRDGAGAVIHVDGRWSGGEDEAAGRRAG